MSFKFANEIISEIKSRGPVEVPAGSVSGEEFEDWLYGEDDVGTSATEKDIKTPADSTDFAKHVKEQFGYDISLKPSSNPDTFENLFGSESEAE